MAMEIQKFTEKAQQALLAAQHEAVGRQHPEVTTLHLLLTLAEQEGGVVPRILEKLEVNVNALISGAKGLLDKEGSLLTGLTTQRVDELIADGTIHGGMQPKIGCALSAVNAGVGSSVIVDGRVEHAVLLELFTDQGVGTLIQG